MEGALKADFLTVAEYLQSEEQSEVRHEYVGGVIYSMAGGTREHHLIAGNLFAALHGHLAGGRCQVAIADLKLHLEFAENEIFYYPDLMVTCDPRDTDRNCNRYPKLIVEVMSDSTERVDRVEKFEAYRSLESLEEYVLVSQQKAEVTIYRRAGRWKRETVEGADKELRLDSVNFTMPLAALYRGVLA